MVMIVTTKTSNMIIKTIIKTITLKTTKTTTMTTTPFDHKDNHNRLKI